MSNTTLAYSKLWPKKTDVLVRVCFLYVGQGSSILVFIRDGKEYRTLVIDCNLDETNGGIDVTSLMRDLLSDGKIHAFINTHPHDDHLHGIKELAAAVTVENVWHSGHKKSKKHGTYHEDLDTLIKSVKERKGNVFELDGSRTSISVGEAEVYVLAPAEHVKDEVNDEDPDTRYARIHENCAVLRFGAAKSWILVTGDADLVAFRDHIADYHKDRLGAFVLDASHHGSRSFFMAKEGDKPYLDALAAINPEYVVVSSPTSEESRHEHPHDDAIKLYAAHVGKEKVLHTGENRETFFFDIFADGTHSGPTSDNGLLAEKYGLDQDDDDGDDGGSGGGGKTNKSAGPFVRPSGPAAPMPRKYALSASKYFA